ncbi:MAG: ASCH domain-containing protein [Marinibacterium sp.]
MSDLDDLRARYPGAQTFTFGDSAGLSGELIALVRSGKKTATCGAAALFDSGAEAMPVPGRRDIALTWEGRPALVIETLSVERVRFCDVGEEFALAEGENDSLAGWRADHAAYFTRNGGFSPDMELICERFRVVEDLG